MRNIPFLLFQLWIFQASLERLESSTDKRT